MSEVVFEAGHVIWGGQRINLPRALLEMVHALTGSPNETLDYRQILDRMHGAGAYPEITEKTRVLVRSQVDRLRRAFRAVDPTFDRVEAIRGVGYRWRAAAIVTSQATAHAQNGGRASEESRA